MSQKKEWLIDLLRLCQYNEHFTAGVLAEAFNISKDLAVEVMASSACSVRKRSFNNLRIDKASPNA